MDQHILNHIKHINPRLEAKDIEEAYMVNDYDLFVKLKNGDKYLYDTFTNYFSGFYPEDYELTDDDWLMSFKTKLRKIMYHKRISQDELADCLNVSRRTISRYINGETIPDALTFKKISLALNCDMNDFFYKEY